MIKTLQQYKFLSIFIVSIHLPYFLIALNFNGIYTVDSPGYLFQAQNLLKYHSLYAGDLLQPIQNDYFALRPPFYAFFIIACKAIYPSDYSVLLVQNIIAILLIMNVLKTISELGIKPKIVNIILPICLVFYPAHFVYANTIMSDTIFELLVFLLFIATYSFYKKPAFSKALVIGLIISISLITKPVSILIGLIVCIILLFIKNYPKIHIAYILIFPAIAYISLSYAVQKETGYFQFTSMKSFAAVRCLVKYSAANAHGPDYADSIASAIVSQSEQQATLAQRYQYIDSSCNHFLLNHKMAFLKVYIKGCLTFMFDPGRYDLYKLFNANNDNALGMYQTLQQYGIKATLQFLLRINFWGLLALAILVCWNILVVIVFVLFLLKTHSPTFLKLLIAIFVMYFLLTTGVLGVSRYRIHIYPILLMAILLWANQSNLIKKFIRND